MKICFSWMVILTWSCFSDSTISSALRISSTKTGYAKVDNVDMTRTCSIWSRVERLFATIVVGSTLAFSSTGEVQIASAIDESQTIKLFEQTTPSVAYINTFVEQLDRFSMNVMEVPAGTGSGFVWDQDGHIVTNYHVIRNAANAKVVLTDKQGKIETYNAQVQGVDPDKDVAVLVVPDAKKGKLKPIQVG